MLLALLGTEDLPWKTQLIEDCGNRTVLTRGTLDPHLTVSCNLLIHEQTEKQTLICSAPTSPTLRVIESS